MTATLVDESASSACDRAEKPSHWPGYSRLLLTLRGNTSIDIERRMYIQGL